MSPTPNPPTRLEVWFRYYVLGLTIISAVASGIGLHIEDTTYGGTAGCLPCAIGLLLATAASALLRRYRVEFGCVMGVVWFVVMFVVAVL